MPHTEARVERQVGRQTLSLSHPDKLLFPESQVSKGEMLDYFEGIAPLMLPLIKDRVLSLQRYPGGIGHTGFFQKDVGEHFPDFITTVEVPKDDQTKLEEAVCNNVESLVYLANLDVITFHIWGSRRDKLDRPDRLVFDLDPSEGVDFAGVREAAQHMRSALERIGLRSYPLLTGSRGVHVVVPLKRLQGFDEVAQWSRGFAEAQAAELPKLLTTEFRKAKRGKRVFVDWLRNQYAQTAVAPYSVRAREGAPVAAPITWKELAARALNAGRYTLRDLDALLKRGDVWGAEAQEGQKLPPLAQQELSAAG